MADNTLDVRIKQKYDTEANWNSKNPVLLEGEVGYIPDGRFKVGNGTSTWSQLSYNKAEPTTHTHTKSQITDFPTSLKNPNVLTIQGNGTTLTNGTYDGSAAKTVNITPSSIGAVSTSEFQNQLNKKIDIAQGAENYGKILAINESGNAVTMTAPESTDITYDETKGRLVISSKSNLPGNTGVDPTLSVSGEAADAKVTGMLKSRVDALTSLKEGSTTGDAELQDIRVGSDGTLYSSAGESVRTQISALKGDLEYYRTNNVDMRLNIKFADGGISGNGVYVDSDISSRMNYRSFDTPVIIVSLATTSIYKKQGTNITPVWQNVSTSYPLIKFINDIDAEYALSVRTKNPKENVFIYTIDSMEYDQNYNTSVNIPLDFMGYASYTKGDDGTLKINNPNENIFNKFNPINVKRNGYLEFSNPSNVACVVIKTDENLNVLDNMSKSDSEFRFDVDKGYLYWFYIYDRDAKFKNNTSNIDVLLNYTPKAFEYHDDSKLINIELKYEIGTIDGAGGLVSSDKVIRTNAISVKKNKLVICTFPTSITSKVCATIDDSTNKPIDTMMYSSYSFFAEKDEDVRFTFYKQDLSTITDVSEMPIDDIKIMIFDADANDINVYAPNSRRKGNFLIDGVNGQRLLQALFNSLDSLKVNIMGGDYYVSEIYTTGKSKSKAYLYTNENWTEYVKVIEFIGEQPARTGYNNAVRFHIPDTENADAFMLATRKGTALDSTLLSQCVCHVENICCIGEDYTQDFVYFDLTHAQGSMIEHCEVRGDGSLKGLQVLDTMPNENCVGIRVGYGSNNGIQNYVKHCMCYAVGIGFSNCGEHYIMEDNLAHHCKIGFSFGDRLTRGNFEHPNIMIGCSIEGCYRLMLLSKYGATEESEVDNARNTLICIGLSTETKWEYPKDDSRYNDGIFYRTLPIKEMIKGNYRGRIEADYDGNSLFEADGSGKNMTQTRYY